MAGDPPLSPRPVGAHLVQCATGVRRSPRAVRCPNLLRGNDARHPAAGSSVAVRHPVAYRPGMITVVGPDVRPPSSWVAAAAEIVEAAVDLGLERVLVT